MTAFRAAVALALTLWTLPATAAPGCETVEFEKVPFSVCTADPATDDLRLFHSDGTGQLLGSFAAVNGMLRAEGKALGFAMNAGMYHDNRAPVGLYIENGAEKMRLITSDGPGNFGLLPNGVFCVMEGRAAVIESRSFAAAPPACRFATQSGPMLVIDGALHPRFIPGGSSKYIRNGVGVDATGRAYFVISDRAVNFHTFGRFFRDVLKTPEALFLDGKVSRLYAPSLGRSDLGFALGPIVGLVVTLQR